MKSKILIIITLMSLLFTFSCKTNKENSNSHTFVDKRCKIIMDSMDHYSLNFMSNRIGANIIKSILNSDSMSIYFVEEYQENDSTHQKERNIRFLEKDYFNIEEHHIKDSIVIKRIKYMLLNYTNYTRKKYGQSCLFFPEIIIKLISTKNNNYVLIANSFDCDMISFEDKKTGEVAHDNSGLFHKALLHSIRPIFINNDKFFEIN